MNEYEVAWSAPGFLSKVHSTNYKNYKIEVYYNSGVCNYSLIVCTKSGRTIFEKEFIITKSDAVETGISFINNRIKSRDRSITSRVLNFFKKGK